MFTRVIPVALLFSLSFGEWAPLLRNVAVEARVVEIQDSVKPPVLSAASQSSASILNRTVRFGPLDSASGEARTPEAPTAVWKVLSAQMLNPQNEPTKTVTAGVEHRSRTTFTVPLAGDYPILSQFVRGKNEEIAWFFDVVTVANPGTYFFENLVTFDPAVIGTKWVFVGAAGAAQNKSAKFSVQ